MGIFKIFSKKKDVLAICREVEQFNLSCYQAVANILNSYNIPYEKINMVNTVLFFTIINESVLHDLFSEHLSYNKAVDFSAHFKIYCFNKFTNGLSSLEKDEFYNLYDSIKDIINIATTPMESDNTFNNPSSRLAKTLIKCALPGTDDIFLYDTEINISMMEVIAHTGKEIHKYASEIKF